MFQNADRAREAAEKAEKAALRSGTRPEVARRRAHVAEMSTKRKLDEWTKANVGLN
jgi:hypothetical protein